MFSCVYQVQRDTYKIGTPSFSTLSIFHKFSEKKYLLLVINNKLTLVHESQEFTSPLLEFASRRK